MAVSFGGLPSQELTDDSFDCRVAIAEVDRQQFRLEGCRCRSWRTAVSYGGLPSQELTDGSFIWRVAIAGVDGRQFRLQGCRRRS